MIRSETKLRLESSAVPVRPGEGLTSGGDTAASKKAEAIDAAGGFFGLFMDNLPGYAWMKDLGGRYVYLNRTLREVPQYQGDCIGKTDFDLLPSEIAGQYTANDRKVIAARERLQTVEPYLLGTEECYALVTKFPILDETGAIVMVGGVSVDITDRVHAEEELQKNETQLAEAQHLANLGSWDWDIKRDRLTWSRELFRIFGIQPEEFDGTVPSFLERVHPDDRERIRVGIEAAVGSGQPYDYELRICRPDGSVRVLHTRGRVSYDESGEPVRMFGVAQDVSDLVAAKEEQKEADERLRAANERLRILSRRLFDVQEAERRHLARELHDELGQALTVAKMNTDMLRVTAPKEFGPRLAENASILEWLLQQTRRISLDLRPPLLDDLGLVPALRWYAHHQAERAGLVSKFAGDPAADDVAPHIRVACFRLAQEAVTNVIRHARAKVISVELKREDRWIRLVVRDDGAGFDVAEADLRAKRGGSLGLLGMNERAALAGGTARVISSPGKGTTVEVILPAKGETDRLARAGEAED